MAGLARRLAGDVDGVGRAAGIAAGKRLCLVAAEGQRIALVVLQGDSSGKSGHRNTDGEPTTRWRACGRDRGVRSDSPVGVAA